MKRPLLALLLIPVAGLFAQPAQARIDIDATRSKIPLTNFATKPGGYGANASWLKPDQKPCYAVLQADVTNNQFVPVELKFTPLGTGTVTLQVKGPYYKKEGDTKNTPVFVFWDKLEVEGAVLKNGDFETAEGWILQTNVPATPEDAQFSKDAARVKSGKGSLRVCHDRAAFQMVDVKSNVQVTLRGWAQVQK
ncbi:MAG: hypothetical protein J0L75_00485 [Spirochaetes bacterium]|nr:hypothetical protein [Spirochaetota bacterium]